MNRNITLIVSAVVVVALLVIWLYLMFFAGPRDQGPIEGSGTYSEFGGLGGDAEGPGPDTAGTDDREGGLIGGDNPDTEAYDPDRLRQLTTKNVAGYREVEIASTTHVIFMESGVGHIYSINLSNGAEERVSATTIPEARVAEFSSDGSVVAVKTGNSSGVNPVSLAYVDFENQSIVLEPIEEQVAEFSFSEEDVLMYGVVNNSSVAIKTYDSGDGVSTTLFSTPFREAAVKLGPTPEGPHYFWPKTSHLLEGFVYRVEGETFTRLPVDGFGLSANAFGDKVFASYRNQEELVSVMYEPTMEAPAELSAVFLPDKCVDGEFVIYCAGPRDANLQFKDIDGWYQGTESFSDSLWVVISAASSEELVYIAGESGRNVDVKNGAIGVETGSWYFQNKIDNTLWVYEVLRLDEIKTEEI